MRSGPKGAEVDPANKLKLALYTAAALSEDVDFITRNFRAFMFQNLTDDSTVKCQCVVQSLRFFTCYSLSRESREKKTKCDRITPSHPLSWPCVSDLLYLKARAATRRRNPRCLDSTTQN